MKLNISTSQKIGLVYGILVILVVIALGVRFWQGNNLKNRVPKPVNNVTKTDSSKPKKIGVGKISLVSDASQIKVGESVDISIVFEAPGKKLDGMDVVLHYDPRILSAQGFSEGSFFKLYPRKDIDNKLGVIKVTALDSSQEQLLSNDKITLGKVSFSANQAGLAQVSFDFSVGTTGKTAMTEAVTSENILGEATVMTIEVIE